MSDHQHPHPPHRSAMHGGAHGHLWVVGVVGIAAGAAMMIFLPQLKIASTSLLLFAGFHVVGGIVLLASAWGIGLRGVVRRWLRPGPADRIEFGWGPAWMNGLAIAALVALTVAVVVQLQFPTHWPLAFLAVALAVVLLVGNLIMGGFRRPDQAVLPMVELFQGERPVILDAGCGAGRTTLAVGKILRQGHIVAVDRFDAGYIDEGGRAQLERNLRLAGLEERVTIEAADLTALPFAEGDFDAVVSTHVYDHLGTGKQAGLDEAYRVLKPGGRFLMAVWTPGWSMFAVGNLLSFFLTSKAAWRSMVEKAGFKRLDEGAFNNAWYLLLEKPQPTPAA
ncbi:SAM-dependent methyltransferase [Caulobacter ginsengisoli]|uniref:SAM-dependent methyltransferase n=1 Tax=Caulobacter ginsengisoli TaxID=400775 RepID=A0ABU0IP68_9CAUL|nr:class I SAM-dependent methyltransferase [Caulobacter ginsengisoli]MDQ0463759.1 SAM-dependent methyltransferase [Caulobacter ginsengisoli]